MDARQIIRDGFGGHRVRWCKVVLAVALLSGCSRSGSPSAPVSFQSEEWTYRGAVGTRMTSEHYLIFTTCKPGPFVEALPTFLESCWQAYSELLPPTRTPDQPLATYLFQTRWQWERFTEEFTGPRAAVYKQIRSGGYSERGVTVSHYGSRRSTLSILAHEGLHQYLDVTHGKPIPAWTNEGLACYFESFDLGLDNRPVFIPERNTLRTPALRAAFSRNTLQPLDRILATDAGQEIHKRSVDVLGYYAQAWSIIVFLMRGEADNAYRDGFLEMLSELGTDNMERRARAYMAADTNGRMSYGEAVFRAYITDDLVRFHADYTAWLPRLLEMQ